jgi:hypothetical protein
VVNSGKSVLDCKTMGFQTTKAEFALLASDSDCSGNSVMPQDFPRSSKEFGIGEESAVVSQIASRLCERIAQRSKPDRGGDKDH